MSEKDRKYTEYGVPEPSRSTLRRLGCEDDDLPNNEMYKYLHYAIDENQKVIKQTQICQRNWNYTRSIDPKIVEHLLWVACNAPSKQYEAYYDVYWSTDRDTIQEMSRYTWGCTHHRDPPSTWRNAQANANMYMVFVGKEPDTQLNCHQDGSLKENSESARWENAYVSVGIAMGQVMYIANQLGLVTGANKSHGDMNGDLYWEKKLGIEEDVAAGRKRITYGIGIGYPNRHRPRWQTDETELALGSGNGDTLTTLPPDEYGKLYGEFHPMRTSSPFRSVKIVDTNEYGGQEVEDYYGNKHYIPESSNIKINTIRERIINCTEIK